MERVVIVDPDKTRQMIVSPLREAGFSVVEEDHWEGGLRRVRDEEHYLVVMHEDASPPGDNDFLPALRRITDAPIIVVGAGTESAKVRALLNGADVYLAQPVNTPELLARTRALLRRYASKLQSARNAHMDVATSDAEMAKVFARLSKTEARLFRYLLDRPDQLVAREELMEGVWGDRHKGTSLRFYIWQLRRKLAGLTSVEIFNFKGMGYLLKCSSNGRYSAENGFHSTHNTGEQETVT